MNKIQQLSFFIAAASAVVLCLFFILPGVGASRPLDRFELQQKINPNFAPPESLARLPGIGLTRAQAIVTYREDYQGSDKGDSAFQNCDDLQKVKGIGPGITKNICRYLKFNGE